MMVVARFVIVDVSVAEASNDSVQEILKSLGNMGRLYSAQRNGIKEISLQVASALIVTLIKRGAGRYIVVDSSPVEEVSFDEYNE